MLQSIRTKTASWVVKILFILLVASFAVWGVEDIFRTGGREDTAIRVGEIKIPSQQVNQEFQRELSRIRQQLGQMITAEQAAQFGMLDQVIQRLTNDALYTSLAQDTGLVVTEEMVRDAIRAEPAFRSATGDFDRNQFAAALRSIGMTEEGYVDLLRRDLARRNVVEAVVAGTPQPEGMIDNLYRFRGERRVADLVFIANQSVGDVAQPTEEELAASYKENERRYMTPEYRGFTYVSLNAEALAGEILIPEPELRQEYEARRAGYTTPETRDLDQMLFSDEATARKAADALAAGQDFAAVAKEIAGQDAEAIKLGATTRSEMIGDMGDAVFALGKGAVSAPLQSPFGWHIFRVNAIAPGSTRSFEEVRDDLNRELALQQAHNQLFEQANRVEDALAGGSSVEEVAQTLGRSATKIDALTRQGQTPDGKPVDGLPARQQILETVFATAQGDQSPLVEAGNDGYFLLRVDAITPPAVKPLDEVRDQVRNDILAERRAEAAKAKAEALAKAIAGGKTLAEAATEAGLNAPAATAPFTRDGQGLENLPRSIATAGFRAKQGEAQVVDSRDGQYVLVVTDIRAADPAAEASKPEIDAVKQTVQQGIASDILSTFSQALRQSYPVEIDRSRLTTSF
ncbi:MAG: SurA N-terminal domain-containing protein [Alphaproteobacteria bacterium]|nr:SurA N-terminal domain-containing protein [Alphaproteobacteria bacterium]MBU0797773.1 SurA N-terminal domain-containing protein [Alphaproteobacteria bacterium]MBU0887835.1 SurA N-terminal domain-containing protein [Alphaproteobacteria bacterium]MBU1814942.1 SurA N-terminal domain-containing protein [Alphaproteobacteria bacterium]